MGIPLLSLSSHSSARCASHSPLVSSSFTEPSSFQRRFEPQELDRPPLSAGLAECLPPGWSRLAELIRCLNLLSQCLGFARSSELLSLSGFQRPRAGSCRTLWTGRRLCHWQVFSQPGGRRGGGQLEMSRFEKSIFESEKYSFP